MVVDRRENLGAWCELKRLAVQKVRGITEAEAEAYASSGMFLLEWINQSPDAAAWRARCDERHEQRWSTHIKRWWRSVRLQKAGAEENT